MNLFFSIIFVMRQRAVHKSILVKDFLVTFLKKKGG